MIQWVKQSIVSQEKKQFWRLLVIFVELTYHPYCVLNTHVYAVHACMCQSFKQPYEVDGIIVLFYI